MTQMIVVRGEILSEKIRTLEWNRTHKLLTVSRARYPLIHEADLTVIAGLLRI